jgi:hypothetical protein
MDSEEVEIERGETGIRILLFLLFAVIFRLGTVVLAAVVVFELLYALITRRPPNDRVRSFANRTLSYLYRITRYLTNRTLSYLYRITRYLTYNQSEVPFPFSDFPPEVEPSPPASSIEASGDTSGGAERAD